MARRLLPASLRSQLVLAIGLITVLAVGLSFLAVYNGTTGRLQDRIDADLTTQATEWQQMLADRGVSSARDLERVATIFVEAQGYHPAAQLFVVDIAGGPPVSNQPRTIRHELEESLEHVAKGKREPGHGIIHAPEGLSTERIHDAGRMRVLTRRIEVGGRRAGTFQAAEPLSSVKQAKDSMLRTFLLVGSLALVLAVLAGSLLAAVIAAPLRRIAGVAAAVDAGDLSLRAGVVGGGRGEVGVLAAAFDRMLARLERAFVRQRDFVSDASHELRTPLAVLRAQVELLDRETDAGRRRDGSATLLRRLDEIDRLVADLLTLASAEAGRLIEPRPVDLDDFFADLHRDLPLFGERDFHLEAVAGTLYADPDRLTQVLRNLVRNAVAHTTPDDRIDVVARVAGDRLTIAVADSGTGVAPEHLEHLFERFYRAEESRSRDSGGSGLGLAIARAIVEAHGGSIRAESQLGRGTKVTLELPGYVASSGGPVSGR